MLEAIDWDFEKIIPTITYGIFSSVIFSLLQIVFRKKSLFLIIIKTKFYMVVYSVLAYVLPLVIIVYTIINAKCFSENILSFIVICFSFVFNIMMRHVNIIYDMITELTSKAKGNDEVHKKAINILFEKLDIGTRIK